MPTYTYKARDTMGKSVKGTMDAGTKDELVDKLHKMGYMTTQVTEALPGIKIESFLEKLMPINTEDMIMFYVQLSNMINAGIPILTCLDTLNKQIENRLLKETVGGVLRSVEGGNSLSQALARYPRIFPKLFVNIAKAGEASGKLDMVSARYAVYFEHQIDLRQKIKGALFYPMILLFAGIAVTLFIVTFVIPQFVAIFMKTGIALPLPTLILFKIGIGIKQYWYLGVLLVIALWLGIRFYGNREAGRLNFDRLKLRLPIIGPLHRKGAISRFGRTLGTLTASGVPILESLDITKEVIGNEVLARVIGNARTAVEKGERISEPLRISGEFPPDTVQMILVGEETGGLPEMLDKISDFYDMSLGYTIKKLTTVLEPIFLLIMGCLVGFIMASMLLPMFDMMKMLRH